MPKIHSYQVIGTKLTVIVECPDCHKNHEVLCDETDYQAWKAGTLIQDAMPYLSNSDREILMTGICPPCWDSMFSEDEE